MVQILFLLVTFAANLHFREADVEFSQDEFGIIPVRPSDWAVLRSQGPSYGTLNPKISLQRILFGG